MSFKSVAYQILKDKKKPLHSKEISKIAIKTGKLKTNGKTPWATMNAVLITDVNSKRNKSKFIKTGQSTFTINKNFAGQKETKKPVRSWLDEEFVKHSIIKYISSQGWGSFEYDALHARGVDIRAKQAKYPRYLSIETKGSSELRQTDETGFIYSLGQIVTRMKDSKSTRNYYGIGLPEFGAKIAIRRLPWQVAKKLLLSIYSVNAQGEVEEFSWAELKKMQSVKRI